MTPSDIEHAVMTCRGVVSAAVEERPGRRYFPRVRIYVMGGVREEVLLVLRYATPAGIPLVLYHVPNEAITETDL